MLAVGDEESKLELLGIDNTCHHLSCTNIVSFLGHSSCLEKLLAFQLLPNHSYTAQIKLL